MYIHGGHDVVKGSPVNENPYRCKGGVATVSMQVRGNKGASLPLAPHTVAGQPRRLMGELFLPDVL